MYTLCTIYMYKLLYLCTNLALVITVMETYRVNEDQGAGKLCHTSNGRATIQIVTRDKTALGEFYQLVGM